MFEFSTEKIDMLWAICLTLFCYNLSYSENVIFTFE